jgi:hypothetical protein
MHHYKSSFSQISQSPIAYFHLEVGGERQDGGG